ncbi:MAG: hypothetical protein AAFY02_13750 [Pseudomonadota bacterium]
MTLRAPFVAAGLLSLGLLFPTAAAQASCEPRAQVWEIKGQRGVALVTRDGERQQLTPWRFLLPGDSLVFSRITSSVRLRMETNNRTVSVPGRDSPYVIAGTCELDWEGPDTFDVIPIVFEQVAFQTPRLSKPMSPVRGHEGSAPPPENGPLDFKNLPDDQVFLIAPARRSLSAGWSGAPGFLQVIDDRTGAVLAESPDSAVGRATLALPPVTPGQALTLVLRTALGDVTRRLEVADEQRDAVIPEAAQAYGLATAAAWLYLEGPPAWRLDAQSRLATMAEEGSFFAHHIWRYAIADSAERAELEN